MANQQRLFDDADAHIELRVQSILASRRRANASGQDGEDIDNIRMAFKQPTPANTAQAATKGIA